MRFRPRYSLLSLLVVTALVAVPTWYWFKPTRYHFDLTQVWNPAEEHDPIEENLRHVAASSGRRTEGSLEYNARRKLFGPPEFLAAKYVWNRPPLLTKFAKPNDNRDYFLLTRLYVEEPLQEIQETAAHYGLTVVSTEKIRCWVSAQIESTSYLDIEPQSCGTGLRQIPIGADPEAETSYLLTENKKIYQLNRNGALCDLKLVSRSQVANSCKMLLNEEIEKLND